MRSRLRPGDGSFLPAPSNTFLFCGRSPAPAPAGCAGGCGGPRLYNARVHNSAPHFCLCTAVPSPSMKKTHQKISQGRQYIHLSPSYACPCLSAPGSMIMPYFSSYSFCHQNHFFKPCYLTLNCMFFYPPVNKKGARPGLSAHFLLPIPQFLQAQDHHARIQK